MTAGVNERRERFVEVELCEPFPQSDQAAHRLVIVEADARLREVRERSGIDVIAHDEFGEVQGPAVVPFVVEHRGRPHEAHRRGRSSSQLSIRRCAQEAEIDLVSREWVRIRVGSARLREGLEDCCGAECAGDGRGHELEEPEGQTGREPCRTTQHLLIMA